jgi:hypothetical protein
MGIAKQLLLMTVQWSKKHSLAITVFLALVSIGVGYLQTRDPSRADFEFHCAQSPYGKGCAWAANSSFEAMLRSPAVQCQRGSIAERSSGDCIPKRSSCHYPYILLLAQLAPQVFCLVPVVLRVHSIPMAFCPVGAAELSPGCSEVRAEPWEDMHSIPINPRSG